MWDGAAESAQHATNTRTNGSRNTERHWGEYITEVHPIRKSTQCYGSSLPFLSTRVLHYSDYVLLLSFSKLLRCYRPPPIMTGWL
jgi:hypothetical protein